MVASKPVDFRKGMDSLAALVTQALTCDPFDGACGRGRALTQADLPLDSPWGLSFTRFDMPKTDKPNMPMRLDCILSNDRDQAILTLIMDENALGRIVLETPDLEDLIHKMALIRAAMVEPIPDELEPHARLNIVQDPFWKMEIPSSHPEDGVLLTIRHPGLGWLASLLSFQEAERLGQSLLDCNCSRG